jgi:hypothetical protein
MPYNPCIVLVDGKTANAEQKVTFVRNIISGIGEHAGYVWEVLSVYRNLVAKPEGKKPLSWPSSGRESIAVIGAVSVLGAE